MTTSELGAAVLNAATSGVSAPSSLAGGLGDGGGVVPPGRIDDCLLDQIVRTLHPSLPPPVGSTAGLAGGPTPSLPGVVEAVALVAPGASVPTPSIAGLAPAAPQATLPAGTLAHGNVPTGAFPAVPFPGLESAGVLPPGAVPPLTLPGGAPDTPAGGVSLTALQPAGFYFLPSDVPPGPSTAALPANPPATPTLAGVAPALPVGDAYPIAPLPGFEPAGATLPPLAGPPTPLALGGTMPHRAPGGVAPLDLPAGATTGLYFLPPGPYAAPPSFSPPAPSLGAAGAPAALPLAAAAPAITLPSGLGRTPALPGLFAGASPTVSGGESAGFLPPEALPFSSVYGVDAAPSSRSTASAAPPAVAPAAPSGAYYFLPPAPSVAAGTQPTEPPLARRQFDVHVIRRDFPILQERVHGKQLVWLDNAATTQKPRAVIDRLVHYYEHEYSNVHRGAHALAARSTDAFEDARGKVARFLGAASPSEIVFVRGTTEGVNLVANSWGRKHLKPGDEIVLSTLEHHSNIVPWQFLAETHGVVLRVIPVTDRGEVLLGDVERLLGPRTKMVAVTHVSNALGTVLPVAEIIHAAHRYGARVLIDGAQAVAHFPVDVQALDADFYIFSGHKLFAPSGVGVVYGKAAELADMPPWQGGGNMIEHVTFERSSFMPPPMRFEAGTGTLGDAVGLGAAVDYLERIGMPNISRHEHELLVHATEALGRIRGVRLIGTAPEKAGVVSFVTDRFSVEEMGNLLDQEGIAVRAGHHCAQPSLARFGLGSTVRPSFAFYNTHDEIDFLASVVRRALQR